MQTTVSARIEDSAQRNIVDVEDARELRYEADTSTHAPIFLTNACFLEFEGLEYFSLFLVAVIKKSNFMVLFLSCASSSQ